MKMLLQCLADCFKFVLVSSVFEEVDGIAFPIYLSIYYSFFRPVRLAVDSLVDELEPAHPLSVAASFSSAVSRCLPSTHSTRGITHVSPLRAAAVGFARACPRRSRRTCRLASCFAHRVCGFHRTFVSCQT